MISFTSPEAAVSVEAAASLAAGAASLEAGAASLAAGAAEEAAVDAVLPHPASNATAIAAESNTDITFLLILNSSLKICCVSLPPETRSQARILFTVKVYQRGMSSFI